MSDFAILVSLFSRFLKRVFGGWRMLDIYFKEISLIIDDEKTHFKLYLSQSILEIINMINLEKHLKNELLKISQIHDILFLKRDT